MSEDWCRGRPDDREGVTRRSEMPSRRCSHYTGRCASAALLPATPSSSAEMCRAIVADRPLSCSPLAAPVPAGTARATASNGLRSGSAATAGRRRTRVLRRMVSHRSSVSGAIAAREGECRADHVSYPLLPFYQSFFHQLQSRSRLPSRVFSWLPVSHLPLRNRLSPPLHRHSASLTLAFHSLLNTHNPTISAARVWPSAAASTASSKRTDGRTANGRRPIHERTTNTISPRLSIPFSFPSLL